MILEIAVFLIKRNYNSIEIFISRIKCAAEVLYLCNTTKEYSCHLNDRFAVAKSDKQIAVINSKKMIWPQIYVYPL